MFICLSQVLEGSDLRFSCPLRSHHLVLPWEETAAERQTPPWGEAAGRQQLLRLWLWDLSCVRLDPRLVTRPAVLPCASHHGDPVPGLSAGVPDLLQLLQPTPKAQAAGLQAHVLLSVPAADEDQPEGPALPLVPRDHQAATGVLCVAAAWWPRGDRRHCNPPHLWAHPRLHQTPQQWVLHAALAPLQGEGATAWRHWLPPPAWQPAEVPGSGDNPTGAAATAGWPSHWGGNRGAGPERCCEKLYLVGGLHCDPGGLCPSLSPGHRPPQHVVHFQALHSDLLRLRRAGVCVPWGLGRWWWWWWYGVRQFSAALPNDCRTGAAVRQPSHSPRQCGVRPVGSARRKSRPVSGGSGTEEDCMRHHNHLSKGLQSTVVCFFFFIVLRD